MWVGLREGCKSHEVQWVQVQDPAVGSWQSQKWAESGRRRHLKQSWGEGLKVSCGWKAGRELSTCCPLPAQKTMPWSTCTAPWGAVEGGDSALLLVSHEAPSGILCSSLFLSSIRKMWTCESRSRRGPWNWWEVWNTSPIMRDRESWGCSTWQEKVLGRSHPGLHVVS